MSGLDPRRLVKITSVIASAGGKRKYLHGTGYFVSSDLVLTANHVLSEGNPLELNIFVEATSQWIQAELKPAWRDTELDALLLKVDPPLDGIVPLEFLETSIGKNESWESTGYPIAATQQGDDGTEWKSAGLTGELYALGGGGQGQRDLELGVDNPPAGNGWQGISGAPVFIGDKFAGIIKSHLPAFEARRLAAVPSTQLVRSKGFLSALSPPWLEPYPIKPWCLILVSEAQKDRANDIQLQVSSAIKRKITQPAQMDVHEEPKIVNITEALENRTRWLMFIEAICAAPIMLIDVTDFEPAVMLMLGIRAVVRRGVTITTTSAKIDTSHLSALPFNIQETKLISLAESFLYEPTSPQHPVNKVGQAILDGLTQIRLHPSYLDLPAYDAVRCPEPKAGLKPESRDGSNIDAGKINAESGARRDFQSVQDTVLMLCPFRPDYEKNRLYVSDRILTVAARDLVRMLDIMSPRLVGQALYEHIRWSTRCIVDWTHWRPNVFFELGVRLACSSIGPVCLIDEDQLQEDSSKDLSLKQRELLTSLLDPIKYRYNGPIEPFIRAWKRCEAYVNRETMSRPFSVLEHDETYRAIELGAYDWRQEPITTAPHEELLSSVEIQLGKDPQSVGKYPTLFSLHPEFAVELQRSAAERGIAAWYYFLNRHSEEEIRSNNEIKEQLIFLGEKVLQWIPRWSEYTTIRSKIDDMIDNLYDDPTN